ncbi:hypothetical protein SLEP1_g48900 [Rubroshorea leprosula]|uniref:Uncharacterized protein n=1 Tax=Rubroshorea leprosula TaxID=152421 RepID=A0AAV5LV45_9ROSI|nr:hypothetical protein SLEP1_g48900 [Rubroshorea leprosula]
MLGFIRRALIEYSRRADYVRYIRTIPSPKTNSSDKQQSPTVSYLTGSCGLSLDKAISASRFVQIENTEGPDSVLRLLESHGFTKSNIIRLISKYPKFLLANPEKTLRPKIEFFESLGIVGEDLTKILCSHVNILSRSLEKKILPLFVPNISRLRAEEVVNEVKAMGFDPAKKTFILAIRSKAFVSREIWEKRKELLMSYGWSEKQFQLAVVMRPDFMLTSEKKMRKMMDFLLNTASLKPVDVAICPNLFLCSLENKFIPRWSLLKVLMSKGLVKHVNLVCAFIVSNKYFEKKYVTEYEEDFPEITMAYREQTGFKDLVADCET